MSLQKSWLLIITFVAAGTIAAAVSYAARAENAADLYREALKAVPREPDVVATLTADAPSAEATAKAVSAGKRSLELVHHAASVGKCDWGIDVSGGAKVDLSFLRPGKLLYGLSKLKAKTDLDAGRNKEAATTLAETMLLGRRIETIPLIISRLMGAGFENGAIDQAAACLPRLDAGSVRLLTETFQELPTPATLDAAIAAETKVNGQEVKPETLEGPRAMDLAMEVRRAMFAAALAAPKGGSEHFKSTRDPVGGKPFKYRQLDGGYELSSQGQERGEPITLVVGTAR